MINIGTEIKELIINSLSASASSTSASEVRITGKNPDKESDLPSVIVSLESGAKYDELGFCGYVEYDEDAFHYVYGYKYVGKVSLDFLALSGLTRDKVRDKFITMLMFDKGLKQRLADNDIMIISGAISGGMESEQSFQDGTEDVLYSTEVSFSVYAELFIDTETMGRIESIRIISYMYSEPDPESSW